MSDTLLLDAGIPVFGRLELIPLKLKLPFTLEIRHGKSNSDSLRGLAKRTGVPEVSSLVAMLVQTERFGTSLADTLRVHSDEMRVKRILRAEEAAGKLPIKMLFPTVLIFVASLIVTIGPGMMQLMSFFE